MRTVTLSQQNYWWGNCVWCPEEPLVIIASNEPIESEADFDFVPDCPRCGRSLDWNQG
jgi:hypothetical protein